ncbi:hypothetical protein [Draconibacterium halophilum]|uniref:Lipocalin-like domain-containing protein n=1 Tax=Draconibacterium halophilum TaxID=2706887 RepID=A0A6C0RCC1_9BACT|nr:hypothetical protein [Draconibacterium halophilum]QIA07133.1 hypothetical protein G0Q07_05040 [Draconibacterium halophilum]
MKNVLLLLTLFAALLSSSCSKDELPDDELSNTSWKYIRSSDGLAKTMSFSDDHQVEGVMNGSAYHVEWSGNYSPVDESSGKFVVNLDKFSQYPLDDKSLSSFKLDLSNDHLSVIDIDTGEYVETYTKD